MLWHKVQGAGGAKRVLAVSHVATSSSSTESPTGTYTFSSLSLGSASTDRHIVVCLGVHMQTKPSSVTAVTVAGVSATKLVSTFCDVTFVRDIGVWVAYVPAGTSGDVVLTTPNAGLTNGPLVRLYSVTGAYDISLVDSATYSQNSTGSGTQALNVDTIDGGAIFGIGIEGNGNTGMSWSGITEDYEIDLLTGEYVSVASAEITSTETPRSVSYTYNTARDTAGLVASIKGV